MKLNPINSRLRVLLGAAFILAMFATFSALADYPSTVLGQGPVGYWRLNETTQPPPPTTTTANSGTLGSSADGTYHNNPARGLTGPFTGSDALGFDGVSQTVTTGYQQPLNTGSFTIETWVNPASATVAGGLLCMASSSHAASPRQGWLIYQSDGTAAGAAGIGWYFRMYNTNGTAFSLQLLAPQTVTPGTWTHLVFTFDGTTANAYINGALVGTGTPTGNPIYVPNTDSQFELGARSDNAFYWPGQEAEVALYTTALSVARISAHYTAATTAPTTYATTVQADAPVLYYRFRELPDVTAANSSSAGSSLNGKFQNGTTTAQLGPRPTAYPGFEAANYSVLVPGSGQSVSVPALNLNTNTVTISGWVNTLGVAQNGLAGIIVCHGGSTDAGIIMDFNGGTFGLSYVWAGDQATYNWLPTDTNPGFPPLPASGWAYVALVTHPDHAELYMASPGNTPAFIGATNVYPHVNQAFDQQTLFGSDAGQTAYGFNGLIDEVAMWGRSLGAGELYTQYGAAVGGLAPTIFGDLQGPSGPVAAGDPITLTVDAGGTPPLTFIWRTNGVVAFTTTNNTLTIGNSHLTDSGSYDVIISNSQSTASSSSVAVSVVTPSIPQITQIAGYQSRTLYPTGTLSFAVSATGGGLKYQWYKNASPIASAMASSFSIANVSTNDAGRYSVSITNVVGVATSGPPAVITIPTVATNSYEAAIIKSAPEAWWRLDESSGTIMFDGMGRHDGVYTNASGGATLPTLGAAGALVGDTNTAASFTSAGQGIGLVPYSANLNGPSFAIEAWVKTTVLDGQAPVSSSYGSGGCWIQSITASGFPGWFGDSSGGYFGNNGNANTNAQIIPGQWSHVVINYNAGNATYPFDLYVNGQTDGYIWGGSGLNSGGPFIIGARGVSATTLADRFFDGSVDEVAVYKRTLGATEIQAHYAARGTVIIPVNFTKELLSQTVTAGKSVSFTTAVVGTQPISLQWYKGTTPIPNATNLTYTIPSAASGDIGTYTIWGTNAAGTDSRSASLVNVIAPVTYANVTNNLVLHLTMDGDYSDSSGRGNDATAPAGSPPFVTGQIGQAVHVATTPGNNYLVVSDPQGDLSFDANASWSIAFWINYTARFNDVPIIGNAVNSTYQLGWTLTDEGGKIEWSLVSTANSGAYIADPVANSPIIGDGAWHQVLGVVDRSSQFAYAYVDGVLAGQWSIIGLGTLSYGNLITIGEDPTGNYGSATFNLDDLGIWRQALTAVDAAQIESAGRAGNSFNTVGAQPITITTTRSGANVTLHYSAGTLYYSTNVTAGAQWNLVPNANPPAYTFTPGGTNTYYRVK